MLTTTRFLKRFGAVAVALACICGPAPALAAPATYTHTQTIPVPPASNYSGQGGGDGWALAMTPSSVYNVFHHSSQITVACHRQADASACWAPKTVKDGAGHDFGASGHPGMYLDQATGKLYTFGSRSSDAVGGVVCFDTNVAETAGDPFCGFTELTPAGGTSGTSTPSISNPMVVGTRMYAYNGITTTGDAGAANRMLCFDVSTGAACAGQPYGVGVSGSANAASYPPTSPALIAGRIYFLTNVDGASQIRCFDPASNAPCAGSWPQPSSVGPSSVGAPFPLLSSGGTPTGVCLPSGASAPCWALDGSSATMPAGLAAVLPTTSGWNGQAVTIGPRLYIPNGNQNAITCWDFLANAACSGFPKALQNASLVYTLNVDPQRPDCLWINADNGSAQIQNFDAFSGGACGKGAIRVVSSSFIAPQAQCAPTKYLALRLVDPARGAYADGTVTIADASGTPLSGTAPLPIDAGGAVDLSALPIDPAVGLPQFLIVLSGAPAQQAAVTVELTWRADYDAACETPGTAAKQDSVATPAPAPTAKPAAVPTPAPQGAVLAERAAPKLVGTARFKAHALRFGRTTTLTLRVKNEGNAASTAGQVCVKLSSALVILRAPKGITVKGATICAKRGAIKPGSTVTVASGIVVRGVQATSNAAVSDSANDGVSVSGDRLRVLRVQATRGGGVTG